MDGASLGILIVGAVGAIGLIQALTWIVLMITNPGFADLSIVSEQAHPTPDSISKH